MTDRIAQALQLGTDEARRALSLAGILFAITASYTLVKTARDAVYLAQLPAATLPYVYLGVGVLTTIAAAAFGRFTERTAPSRSLEGAAWATGISLLAFAVILRSEARWATVALYVWVNVYGLILTTLFWAYTKTVSHPREAKRIFGVIGVGGILGGLCGGLLAPALAHRFGIPSLLVAAALIVMLATPWLRASPAAGAGAAAAEDAGDEARIDPLRHPYVRWLAVAGLCSVLVATLLDYQFKIELQRRFTSASSLAAILGLFYTATNLAALTMQLFVTRWSLQTLGAGWSAAVLPVGLGFGALATLFTPGFPAVLTTRLWDQVMRLSINRSATELFFFPLPPGLRNRAQGLIGAGLERLGDGFAGLLILAAGLAMQATTRTLAALVLALVVVWVLAWVNVRRGYVAELGRNLRRMDLGHHHAPVSLREASLLEGMQRLLESPHESAVLNGVEMLEENAPELLDQSLGALLEHPSSGVRARALRLATERGALALRPRVAALVHDPDPIVRVQALRAHWALSGESLLEAVEEFVASTDPGVREAALECLAECVSLAEEPRVRAILEQALRDGPAGERVAVAAGLGHRVAPDPLHDLFDALSRDADAAVRNAALEAAGHAQLRRFVPLQIETLATRESREAARKGLAAFQDRVVGTLGDHLVDNGIAIEVRREIPRVLSMIGTQEAVNALFRHRERAAVAGDVQLGERVLEASNRIRAARPESQFPPVLVTEDLDHDARSFSFALVHYRSCPIGANRTAERLLCIVLNERMDQALHRVFRRLALIYPPDDIFAAHRGVLAEDVRLRGNALEFLENILSPDHRAIVLPLVDDSGDEGRLRHATRRYDLRYVGLDDTLAQLLESEDPWLRACALYVAGNRGEPALLPLVRLSLGALDRNVRETALWAQAALMDA